MLPEFILVAAVSLVWLVALSVWVYKIHAHYCRLTGKTGRGELRPAIESLIAACEQTDTQARRLEQEIKLVRDQAKGYIQKIGVVRFNPFGDTGGNQSAAVALLDGRDCGVVILVLHGRDGTRVYAKTVKNGKSAYNLSTEEVSAIEQARKSKV